MEVNQSATPVIVQKSEGIQHNKNDTRQNESQQGSTDSEQVSTNDQVANNMKFLQNSGANLEDQEVEQEVNEEPVRMNQMDDDQLEDSDVPFQVVKYRKKGKKSTAAQTKTHQTRAKAGSSSLAK